MTQNLIVAAAVPVVAVLLVLALRREQRLAPARRRAAQMRRLTTALLGVQVAMAGLAPAAGKAAVAFRGFADALERSHRTTARPAHRAPRKDWKR